MGGLLATKSGSWGAGGMQHAERKVAQPPSSPPCLEFGRAGVRQRDGLAHGHSCRRLDLHRLLCLLPLPAKLPRQLPARLLTVDGHLVPGRRGILCSTARTAR